MPVASEDRPQLQTKSPARIWGTNPPRRRLTIVPIGHILEVHMTSACNWENRVKRVAPAIIGFNGKLGPIQSDGAFIGDRVESLRGYAHSAAPRAIHVLSVAPRGLRRRAASAMFRHCSQ